MSASTNRMPRDNMFKRGYVACLGCRSRKVKCVLGQGPPCAKCLREHRECQFQPQKRAARHRDAPKWATPQENAQQAISPVQNGGNRNSHAPSSDIESRSIPITEIRSQAETDDPLLNPSSGESQFNVQPSASNSEVSLVSPMMSTIMARPSDALGVLFEAAQSNASPPKTRTDTQVPQPHASAPIYSMSLSNVSTSGLVSVPGLSQPSDDVLDLWDKCRFVRQGWFTAQEAVTYMDLYHEHLAPLTPVVTEAYREHSNHGRLVIEEPMLCCTLLMVSSRFFILPGAGGISRSHFIHQRLWQYCELLIRRIMFGQEKYSTAKTRIVGSIESLILLSNWHPRSVHFPPETEGWDSELISPNYDRRNRIQTSGEVPLIRWREDVFEPAKRSERLSWMLLGAASSLAYELGIFADTSSFTDPHQVARMYRARKLLSIHIIQAAVTMGCASLVPENVSLATSTAQQEAQKHIDLKWDSYVNSLTELTRLIKTASAMFFQSTPYIKQQLLSGQYSILLEHFAPSLARWHDEFVASTSNVPAQLVPLILIEYHYLKTYTSALAIQAVVERAISRGASKFDKTGNDILASCILNQDHKLIRDVIYDSTRILDLATSMAAQSMLRYTPLRIVVCVASASVFLLKALSLGGTNADFKTAINSLHRCIAALRSSTVDDMDFSIRYATLIERYVARFCANFTPRATNNQLLDIMNSSNSSLLEFSGCILTGNANNNNDRENDIPVTQDAIRPHEAEQYSAYHETQKPADDQQFNSTFHSSQQISSDDDWLARPFDPNIAPFSFNGDNLSIGLEVDSLDFLWNLPDIGGQ